MQLFRVGDGGDGTRCGPASRYVEGYLVPASGRGWHHRHRRERPRLGGDLLPGRRLDPVQPHPGSGDTATDPKGRPVRTSRTPAQRPSPPRSRPCRLRRSPRRSRRRSPPRRPPPRPIPVRISPSRRTAQTSRMSLRLRPSQRTSRTTKRQIRPIRTGQCADLAPTDPGGAGACVLVGRPEAEGLGPRARREEGGESAGEAAVWYRAMLTVLGRGGKCPRRARPR